MYYNMYQVTVHHHDKAWRNGDLEDKLELVDRVYYNTRKAAKDFIERQLQGKKDVFRNYHKGDATSWCGYYTGVTWQHENSGEMMKEYYQYTLKKVKLR